MIRKDREITDRSEQLAIMEACDVCRIALNGEDGYPYIVPLNFGVEVDGVRCARTSTAPTAGRSSTSSRAKTCIRARRAGRRRRGGTDTSGSEAARVEPGGTLMKPSLPTGGR